jgi:hypothetical protein
MVCWVLTEVVRRDDRGRAAPLADHPDLPRRIDLKAVPPVTTFPKAATRRLPAAPARTFFDTVREPAVRDKGRQNRVPGAVGDGTGRERRHGSRYSLKRRSQTGTETQDPAASRSPTVVRVTAWVSHLVWAAGPGRGPAADRVRFRAAGKPAVGRARIGTGLADADFDAAGVHAEVRSSGIRTLIPPQRGRPSEKPPAGTGRRRWKPRFNQKQSGQRWPTETVKSLIKRRLGAALQARVQRMRWGERRAADERFRGPRPAGSPAGGPRRGRGGDPLLVRRAPGAESTGRRRPLQAPARRVAAVQRKK